MSQIKINIGCGVFPFPLDRNNIPNKAHLEPLPDIVFEEGWINIDKHAHADVQEVLDLFRFPWLRSSNGNPFNDNYADVLWAAHILEHVPHEVRPTVRGMFPEGDRLCDNYDGFFVFLTECWRILKPDGLLYIRAPYAASYASLSDPTHTRYLTPGSFSYVGARTDSTPFDYDVPCHFELVEPFTLRLINEWSLRIKDYTEEGFAKIAQCDYGVSDEFRMLLRAVKNE